MKHLILRLGWLLSLASTIAWALPVPAAASAAWPQFRGPDSRGIAEGARPPVQFGPGTNLLWKAAVPAGHSSPIVVGDRIIFNGAQEQRLLTCAVDRKTGQPLWRGEIPVEKLEKFHKVSSAAPCTPVSDGQGVYAYLPSFGVVAYDLDGKEQWRKPLPFPQTFMNQGSGASPVLAGDFVIVAVPRQAERQVWALRRKDGSEAWKVTQPLRAMSWATPVSWNDTQGECVGVSFAGQFSAYRISDSKEVWSVTG